MGELKDVIYRNLYFRLVELEDRISRRKLHDEKTKFESDYTDIENEIEHIEKLLRELNRVS